MQKKIITIKPQSMKKFSFEAKKKSMSEKNIINTTEEKRKLNVVIIFSSSFLISGSFRRCFLTL